MTILGDGYTPETYAAKAAELGLDKGYFGQITDYIWKIITRLDFGKSYFSNIPIINELGARFPTTALLGCAGLSIMLLVGIPLGILSAVRHYSVLDNTLTAIAMIMAAVPGFVLALLCLIFFGVRLKWFPISGLDSFKSWVLPVVTNAFPAIASMMRMTRTNMLEVIRQDYIRTARSKGMKENVILVKHALKNCMIPLLTTIGGYTAMVFGGSIIVENIFNIRGLGTYMYGGIMSRDYNIVNGCVLLAAFIVCMINLLVDILYAFIDPRIKALYTSRKKNKKPVAVDSSGNEAA